MLYHDDVTLYGIQLFDKDGVKLLETGFKTGLKKTRKEYLLEDGERIVGTKSRKSSDGYADHNDF